MLQAIIEDKLHKAIKEKSASYLKTIITRGDFNVFKQALSDYLEKTSHKEHEINYVMHLKSFLDILLPLNLIETQGRTDLIIRKGKTKAENAVILFEAKQNDNKLDMITKNNLNKKAFHEMILYFMRERAKNNTDIKHLIINTQTEFFIFNAHDFEKLFFTNTQFRKDFEAFTNKEKTGSKTDFFYDHIAKPFIDKIDAQIPVTYFDLNTYKEYLNQPDNKDSEKKLEHLYKIFTPEFLFNKPLKNDNNSLNKEFYNELLYIIGLHETKENNKYVIQRLPEKQRNPASLIENTIFKIQSKNKFTDANMINQYGLNVDERAFNIALELSLVWINRLLFLKLLEAQIVSYHKNNPDYKFLNCDKIQDYDDLSDLFFEILAKKTHERRSHLQTKFQYIPYLNSSLFEASDLEDAFSISMLNNADLPIYKNTVLNSKNKSLYTELKTLDYIFKFLDAYNFASDNADTIQDAPKTIINASVLGLIFEKINGYKDGSIFTPSYITMYMSRQVIEQAVINKFKEKYNWNIQTIEDLKNHLADKSTTKIQEYNNFVNSLKICDPAVGSGHFLVSCLNELIYIKFYLGILADKDGKRIAGIDITLDNDEIIILNDTTGETYQYGVHTKGVSDTIQHTQQTLFHEKQTLIENCLFGVDINQNSVNICQLRLWIELLKNAYYTSDSNFTELETLPNIDINIKCGNALLNRFELSDNLSSAFKNKGLTVTQYRNMVNAYKNTKDKTIKRNLDAKIKEIKNHFRKEHITKIDRDIAIIERKIIALDTQTEMFGGQDRFLDKHREVTVRGYEYEIKTLEKTKQAYETDLTFMNALEWRFEFPEILDDDGTFIGFDVVIGNPPYIRIQDVEKGQPSQKISYEKQFFTAKGSYDLANLFFELATKISNDKDHNIFILPHKLFNTDNGEALRELINDKHYIQKIVHFGANMVFDNATTYTAVIAFNKSEKQGFDFKRFQYNSNLKKDLESLKTYQFLLYDNIQNACKLYGSNQWIFFDTPDEFTIFDKIYKQKSSISDKFDKMFQGIATSRDALYVCQKIFETETTYKILVNPSQNKQTPLVETKEFEVEKTFFKPFLMGKDVHRYEKLDTERLVFFPYILNPNAKIIKLNDLKNNYPKTYKFVTYYEDVFKARERNKAEKLTEWYDYIYPKNLDGFEQEKLSSMEMCAKYPNVTLNNQSIYHATTVYSFVKKESTPESYLYFLAILNSKLLWWFLKITGDTLSSDTRRIQTKYLNPFPLPKTVSKDTEQKIIDLVQRRMNTAENSLEIEAQIDRLVYALYGLTADEVKVIEGEK